MSGVFVYLGSLGYLSVNKRYGFRAFLIILALSTGEIVKGLWQFHRIPGSYSHCGFLLVVSFIENFNFFFEVTFAVCVKRILFFALQRGTRGDTHARKSLTLFIALMTVT